ncbi:hypothetical protein [Helicobacter cetorum]|uniref:hypothetical protein n=1 Tax=Helicobacter cetorum TaxID=138563 RepID=UPI000CF0B920|nr:hypothetical protein [Helicobacter cetorum]
MNTEKENKEKDMQFCSQKENANMSKEQSLNKQEEVKQENKPSKKQGWFKRMVSKMSLFEKIFWSIIAVFFVLYIMAQIIAYSFLKADELNCQINELSYSLIANHPFPKPATIIIRDYNKAILAVNNSISRNFDELFNDIIKHKIDKYLDKHYTVTQDYKDLYNAVKGGINKAMGNEEAAQIIAEKMAEQLLGDDFEEKFSATRRNIQAVYEAYANEVIADMALGIGAENKEQEINYKMISDMERTTKANLRSLFGKGLAGASGVAGGVVAAKIFAPMFSKIATKVATKFAAKGLIKGGVGAAGGAGGAGIGAALGSVVPGVGTAVGAGIGALIGAATLWFGTDKAVIMADEALYRDKYKKELITEIRAYKSKLVCLYQKAYNDLLINSATNMIEELKKEK